MLAASMAQVSGNGRARGPARLPGRRSARRRRLDRLVELQLAALDLVQTVVGERGVAILVDGVRAEHALAVLRVEDGLEDLLLGAVARALDRVQGEVHRLVAVDGVRLR